MRCPMCNSAGPTVYQTRTRDRYIYRVRQCRRCRHKFKTIEGIAGEPGTLLDLSPEDKQTLRRVFNQVLKVLGIPPEN